MSGLKRAFTLIEVTLAMGILATGVLAIVGLYAFGFRESSQSREDVGATALADAVLGQLTMAITATNLKWSVFRNLPSYPNDDGWGYFINQRTGRLSGDPTSKAKSDFAAFMGKLSGGVSGGSLDCDTSFPDAALSATGLKCGLVIMHEPDSAIVRIGFRASMLVQTMLSAPMFYTEAKFQGVDE